MRSTLFYVILLIKMVDELVLTSETLREKALKALESQQTLEGILRSIKLGA